MNEYVIITDSSCDLPQWKLDEIGVDVVPLKVDLAGTIYTNYPDWREIDPHAFFDELRTGKDTRTSAANVGDFREKMEPYLKEGKDVLYIGFSSGLSATYNVGCLAAQELSAEYPDRKILTVDSLCASLGQGLFVVMAAEQKQQGKSIEEVLAYCEETRPHLCHWFTVDDLFFLHRGGRVSKTTAIIGSTLGIKPVLHVDDEGHLIKMEVARGRKASIKRLVDHMEATHMNVKRIFICHGDCLEDAQFLAGLVKDRLGITDVLIHYVGPVIGAHSGPGTLALFFEGTGR